MMTTVTLPDAAMNQGLVQRPYQTPDGYFDYPFIYTFTPQGYWYGTGAGFVPPVYGGPGQLPPAAVNTLINQYGYQSWPFCNLTQGSAPSQVRGSIRIPGDSDFVLRGWAGAGNLCDSFQLYGPGNQELFQVPLKVDPDSQYVAGIARQRVNVVPELVYPSGSEIRFDLINPVNRNAVVELTDPGDQQYFYQGTGLGLVFYGVRRYKGRLQYPEPSYQDYYQEPFTYYRTFNWSAAHATSATEGVPFNPNIPDFSNLVALLPNTTPVVVEIPIRSYDFELHQISFRFPNMASVINWNDPAVQPAPISLPNANADQMFRVQLFDQSGNKLSNQPVDWFYLCNQSYFRNAVPTLTPNLNTECVNRFPSPPLMYPKGGQIRIEFTTLVPGVLQAAPYEIEVFLHGINRVPCGGQ